MNCWSPVVGFLRPDLNCKLQHSVSDHAHALRQAASPENLALRQREAGDYFWAAVDAWILEEI